MTPCKSWTVADEATGTVTHVKLTRLKRRGRKPKAKTLYAQLIENITNPTPRGSVRLMVGGRETAVHASKAAGEPMPERIERHRILLRKRRSPMATDITPPTGQAALWYEDVIQCVPRSGREVARQIARLCGDDSRVTVPIRSLTDAVGRRDSAGRKSAYTRRGIEALVEAGWLQVETTGSGQSIATTFFLMPGDRWVGWWPEDEADWLEERALA